MTAKRRRQTAQPVLRRAAGQAMVELVICIVIILMLLMGAAFFAKVSHHQILLRRNVRYEAGVKAIMRRPTRVEDGELRMDIRTDPYHRLNAFTRLDTYSPVLPSHLPASNYTLAMRDLPEEELAFQESLATEEVNLESALTRLIYSKGKIRLAERLAFPALQGFTP